MPNKLVEQEAKRRVMEDLLNALLAEELLDGLQMLTPSACDELAESDDVFAAAWNLLCSEAAATDKAGAGADLAGALIGLWRLDGAGTAVVFGLRRSVVQRWRCTPEAVVAASVVDGRARLLSPPELMRLVADSHAEAAGIHPEGTAVFIDMLQQTVAQIAWSMERSHPYSALLSLPPDRALLSLERYAAGRDRPFHPVAKAKLGWERDECGRFTAEAGQPIRLRWMAVRRDRLLSGDDAANVLPQSLLLSAVEQQELEKELTQRGLNGTHIVLPVHPWQMEAMLPQRLRPELDSGVCVPLDIEAGTFYATSSVRSLMSLDDEPSRHVKLPLGIRSLGGLRYLSAIKMMNGVRAEGLLRQARQLDPVLNERLYLCEEGRWWALKPQDNDLFADDPRHLSALIRTYPEELMSDNRKRLVPMSALAADSRQALLLAEWLQLRGLPNTAEAALELFSEIVETFGELSLRLLRFGLVPEAHGQNAVLVLQEGRVCGLLLRDHDALRVHVPWLHAEGLADPEYLLRPGVPNSLYHDSPQQLIAFFQMLGIHVNLFSIMDSLSNAYSLSEERMWTELKEALQTALKRAALPELQEAVISSCLFKDESWPWKQVVRPLLAQTAKVPGSMPYGKGEMPNPLRAARLEEVPYAAY